VKSTFHHFHRNYASLGKRETAQEKKNYDVFGHRKVDARYRSEREVAFNPAKVKPEVTLKVGFKS
jgi:hypothetical protein